MATSQALIDAILAMDVYDRGASAQLNLKDKASIGDISVIGSDETSYALSVGFGATAYSYAGQTIISYRGTVLNPLSIAGLDVLYGYPTGAGVTVTLY
jgi:hypothetical protein